ncbi:MAG: hypothetical protein JRJ04_04445 [Deltaproteobacteria bacterium]|nr:hypothetical protein [Deltaproteobacteria bacterium]
METGIAALKFGLALIFLPFGFFYIPSLLLGGSMFDIAYTFVVLLVGFMSLAMALQGADFINSKISVQRRVVFAAAALSLLLPVPKWINFFGVILMLAGWVPGIVFYRKAAAGSKI